MNWIDFRSDTKTLPTLEMRQAIASAELGDDSHREDPTVAKLEARAAELCGKEAALLVLSGTMGNLLALLTHLSPGDGVLLDRESHIFHYENASVELVARLRPYLLNSDKGLFEPGQIHQVVDAVSGEASPRLLCLENTHNRGGGRVVPLKLQQDLCQAARDRGMSVHLDGARIFNAAVASGVSVHEYAATVDSMMFCLSKGLSCPLGSVLVGSSDFIEMARIWRKRIGGSMRQAGVIAAAGLVALDNMIDRLVEDHLNCKLLAEGLSDFSQFRICLQDLETNIFFAETGIDSCEISKQLEKVKVKVDCDSLERIRFVTSRHHTLEIVREALNRIRQVCH